MAEPHDLDSLNDSLEATLGRIEEEVGKILDGSLDIFGPDPVVEALDSQTRELCEVVEEIDQTAKRAVEAVASRNADLTTLAETAVAQAVEDATFPVVVSSDWHPDIPPLDIPAGGLHAILGIVMRRGVEFAGHGGALRVATTHESDQATFWVEATRSTDDDAPRGSTEADEVAARFESVHRLVEDLGGGFAIQARASTLRLELALPVGIESV